MVEWIVLQEMFWAKNIKGNCVSLQSWRRKGGGATRIRPCKEKCRDAVIGVGSKLVLTFSLGAEG
jgi:hypothetical protein